MPGSRVRVENDLVAIGFDRRTGELLELVNRRTGENVIKNYLPERSMPFYVQLRDTSGKTSLLCPSSWTTRSGGPTFELQTSPDGGKVLQVRYEKAAGDWKVEIAYSVTLYPGRPETIWTIELYNPEPELTIAKVMFPCIFGVYLGERWDDDVLVLPYIAGERIPNPVEAYARGASIINWRWQDYRYEYAVQGVRASRQDDGALVRELQYCGTASMMWLDYFEDGQGLYLASYDPAFALTGIHTETFGPSKPGMGFFMTKYPELPGGGRWVSPPFAVALHEGTWHWGADRYREWATRHLGGERRPPWFEKSVGLVAHYDFKYQSGQVVHRFDDLPRLYDEARRIGLTELLISGWHEGGFDNGFPNYRPDPDLGTETEFQARVSEVRDKGGHLIFYVNSRLSNSRFRETAQAQDEWRVKGVDGSAVTERYGSQEFHVMCPGSKGWQSRLVDTVRWLIDEVGASGVYLDQLSMAPPLLCYEQRHGHEPASWNRGYREILERIHGVGRQRGEGSRDAREGALFIEGCGDIYGDLVCGQLISSFFYWHSGAYPELYKYTFPQHTLVDMVYPSRGQVMRPVHISQIARELINKAFVIGSYLWIYDLEDDNTFHSDPELLSYLQQVIALRRLWLAKFGSGMFRDTVGIRRQDDAITVKRFEVCPKARGKDSTSVLLAVWNKERKPGMYVDVEWKHPVVPDVTYCELGVEPVERKAVAGQVAVTDAGLRVEVSPKELSLVHLHAGN